MLTYIHVKEHVDIIILHVDITYLAYRGRIMPSYVCIVKFGKTKQKQSWTHTLPMRCKTQDTQNRVKKKCSLIRLGTFKDTEKYIKMSVWRLNWIVVIQV